MISGHGDDLYRYGNIVANFSSNVYNNVEHKPLWEHLAGRMECMVSYPEPQPYTLEGAIAEKCGVEPSNVCVTNGATEAIYLVAQCFAGETSVIFVPTFSEYADACKIHRHNVTPVSQLSQIEEQCAVGGANVVWICNPNNPTGKVADKGRLLSLVAKYKDVVFVMDQSYEFFTDKELVGVVEGASYDNLVLLHSMTKRYAVPGVRLGYITASSVLLDSIKSCRMPWAVNAFAIETGMFLLNNDISKSTNINVLLERSRDLAGRLEAFGAGSPEGCFFEVEPSNTHYMLVRIARLLLYRGVCAMGDFVHDAEQVGFRSASAAVLKEHLAKEWGILIRDASNFATLGEGHFRIATQTDAQNELLVKALERLCM